MRLFPLAACVLAGLAAAAVPRNVRIQGQDFVLSRTKAKIVLGGPNVVVKGPPWIPSVSGDTICKDVVNSACAAKGNCTSCTTFNQADVDHIKSLGWNFIRLGVVWAGAQPKDADELDPDFVTRLHALLHLTDANGIHVMLDNHGDMVGTAGCGNGMPMWFQQKAAPELIGKPLKTLFPYNLVKTLQIDKAVGYDLCGSDEAKWAEHAGDPNYNLVNDCCKAMNDGGNPGAIGFTEIQQKSMSYMIDKGPGRDDFVRYWRLMAEAVVDHPSAFAAELMNEPMTLHRTAMFDCWRECAEAINKVIPDMSVSIADIGEGTIVPAWVTELTGGHEGISGDTMKWIEGSNSAFYAWHYGTVPADIIRMKEISKKWNVPSFGTELGCTHFHAAKAANISHSYWHYSCYCNTGPDFGNKAAPKDTFGACILGWGGGNPSACVPQLQWV